MNNKGDLASGKSQDWTHAEDYIGAMARRRTERRKREPKPRTQPEAPRFLLSTLPFLALIGGLAILAVAIMVAAWPGSQPRSVAATAEQHEQGYAPRGWLQKAEKEFRS